MRTCVRACARALTLVKERAQIDQVVRVEVGGTARHTIDKVAQVARVGSRLLLEVREEHAEAIALAQLPLVRWGVGQAAARDGGLAFSSRCSHRRPCRLVYLVNSQN
eukprot:scaffold131859_cov75-Phaeocystis_antarctica.AAC.2